MKMFLTRMGQNARIVVTGDITQVDLPPATINGLADAAERLGRVPGVGLVELDKFPTSSGTPWCRRSLNAYESTEPAGPPDSRAAAGGNGKFDPPLHLPLFRPPRDEAWHGSIDRPFAEAPPTSAGRIPAWDGACPVDHAPPRRFHELW